MNKKIILGVCLTVGFYLAYTRWQQYLGGIKNAAMGGNDFGMDTSGGWDD